MKNKTIFILGIVILFSFSLVLQTEAAVQDNLAIIDHYEHSPEQFLSVLTTIHKNNPDYSTQQIGDMIAKAWDMINEKRPDISIWEVAKGIEEASRDGIVDLAEVIAAFVMIMIH